MTISKSGADSALAQEVVGCIEAINSGVKSASVLLSMNFLAVSALSVAERTPNAAAQLERAARCCRAPDSSTHTCLWQCYCLGLELISRA